MFGIIAKKKEDKRFKPLDYKKGVMVDNVLYADLWSDKEVVKQIVEKLNKEHSEYDFKVVER